MMSNSQEYEKSKKFSKQFDAVLKNGKPFFFVMGLTV